MTYKGEKLSNPLYSSARDPRPSEKFGNLEKGHFSDLVSGLRPIPKSSRHGNIKIPSCYLKPAGYTFATDNGNSFAGSSGWSWFRFRGFRFVIFSVSFFGLFKRWLELWLDARVSDCQQRCGSLHRRIGCRHGVVVCEWNAALGWGLRWRRQGTSSRC